MWWRDLQKYGIELDRGVEKEALLLRALDLTTDFLLPRSAWADFGYKMNGKRVPELLDECQVFAEQVARLGVLTDVSDTAYLVSLMANRTPDQHKRVVLGALVEGGAKKLAEMVEIMNRNGGVARARADGVVGAVDGEARS